MWRQHITKSLHDATFVLVAITVHQLQLCTAPAHLTWTLLLSIQVLIAINAASDQPHSGENYSCVGAGATAPTRSGAAGAAAPAAVEQQRCAAAPRAGASSDGGAKNAVRFAE
jgi:hypothetical protein